MTIHVHIPLPFRSRLSDRRGGEKLEMDANIRRASPREKGLPVFMIRFSYCLEAWNKLLNATPISWNYVSYGVPTETMPEPSNRTLKR